MAEKSILDDSDRICSRIVFVLQVTVALTLLGRGWLIYHFDSKFRSVLWDEERMTGIVQWFGSTWAYYHENSYLWVDPFLEWLGLAIMTFAAVPLLVRLRRCNWFKWLLPLASFLVLVDSYGAYYDSGEKIGMLMEHTLQWMCPIVLLIILCYKKWREWQFLILCLGAAITFIGHGLFAVGYYPVPYYFQTMTMELLDCSESFAKSFLLIVGIGDFLVALGIFIPVVRKYCLYYMVLWGGATALARVITMFESTQDYYGLNEGIAESIARTSHWTIPLVLIFYLIRQQKPT